MMESKAQKQRKKLVFLDRDGTINKESGLIEKPEQLELIPGAAEGIKLLNDAGFIVVIVTNQPQVARGICTEEEVKIINNRLLELLKSERGAKIDSVYYCPHHPDKGYAGERMDYKIDCDCRKPKIGMLKEAAKQFGVKLEDCYFIGDHSRDMKAAENAGCKAIGVMTGSGCKDGKYPSVPYILCADLHEAAKFIIAYETLDSSAISKIPAVIIAGGLGKRLAPLTESIPKPLLPVRGKPVLEHQIAWLKREGISELILCTGYLSEKIESYFGNGSRFGVKICYSVEPKELGTGGALRNAEGFISGRRFISLYGDLLIDIDLRRMLAYHIAKGGLGTLALHPTDHPFDSDMLECSKDGKITAFLGKPRPGQKFENLGNAGLYCFEPAILKNFPEDKSMLDKEALPKALANGAQLYGFVTFEKIADMGTHERYRKHGG